jgi:hypothetical protein
MNASYIGNKIKMCVVGGTGEWGKKVYNAASLVNRYEVIGQIDTSTTPSEKESLLNAADLIYVATPYYAQKEYVEFILKNNKHGICESPFLPSIQDRYEIFNLINKKTYTKIFHINYPYFLDQDFAKIASKGIREKKKLKFIKLECCGNKFLDDLKEAKRMYISQALNLICGICGFLNISKFEKFVVHDDYNGEVFAGDINFLFSWKYSEVPELNISVKSNDHSEEETIVYDQYDQVLPLLLLMSDRINNEIPKALIGKPFPEALGSMQEINSKMVLNTFLMECTAEYFTNKFLEYNGSEIEESDMTKLFFNGGFTPNNQ